MAATEAKLYVGIFWGVPDHGETALVIDSTSLASAEPYGDFLTHPRGHYDVWESWRQLEEAELNNRRLPAAITMSEYEEFPRGRIVYQTQERLFIIYADRKLQTPPMIAQIVAAFGLAQAQTSVRSDLHYRSRSSFCFQ